MCCIHYIGNFQGNHHDTRKKVTNDGYDDPSVHLCIVLLADEDAN